MKKKILDNPKELLEYAARLSGPTLSLEPKSLGLPVRLGAGQQEFAELVSGDRITVSKEYFSPDLDGKTILKSDLYTIFDDKYKRIKGSKYPHHHIKNDQEMDNRIDSILQLAANQKNEKNSLK